MLYRYYEKEKELHLLRQIEFFLILHPSPIIPMFLQLLNITFCDYFSKIYYMRDIGKGVREGGK